MTTVKFLFNKLEFTTVVGDAKAFKMEDALSAIRRLPNVNGNEPLALSYINGANQLTRILSNEDLQQAFEVATNENRSSLRIIATLDIPKELVLDDSDDEVSDFEYIPEEAEAAPAPPIVEAPKPVATESVDDKDAIVDVPVDDKDTSVDSTIDLVAEELAQTSISPETEDSVAPETAQTVEIQTPEVPLISEIPAIDSDEQVEAAPQEEEFSVPVVSTIEVAVPEVPAVDLNEQEEPAAPKEEEPSVPVVSTTETVASELLAVTPQAEEDEAQPLEAVPEPFIFNEPIETPAIVESIPAEVPVTPTVEEKTATPVEDLSKESALPSSASSSDPLPDVVHVRQALDALIAGAKTSSLSLREVAPLLLSKPDVVESLQRIINTPMMRDFVVSYMSALNEGLEPLEASSPSLSPLVGYFNEILPRQPELGALIPLFLIFLTTELKEKLASPSTPAETESQVVHEGVKCDGCIAKAASRDDVPYITGIRYKSSVSGDFDLCSACEAEGKYDSAHGPFLKIKTPEHSPLVILCALKNEGVTKRQALELFAAQIVKALEEGAPQPPAEKVCQNHALKAFTTSHAGIVCSDCRCSQKLQSSMFGCRECGFDLCQPCFAKISTIEAPVSCLTPTQPETVAVKMPPVEGCPGKHRLVHFLTPNDNYTCDCCKYSPEHNAVMYGCRVCNYDLCVACYEELKRNKKAAKLAHAPAVAAAPRASAKFVSDVSFPDGSVVRPGEGILKVWKIENSDATMAWPAGCRLVNVGGETFGTTAAGIPLPCLLPKQVGDIAVPLVVPHRIGRAIGYFRLVDPNSQKFGHRLWIDVQVRAANVQPAAPPAVLPAIAPTVVPPSAPSASNLSEDEKLAIALGVVLEEEEAAALPPTTNDEQMAKFSEQMETLCEIGYLDMVRNLELLEQHNGNLDEVVNQLANEQQ